jgi:aminoglycoside phosphotransferase (APT) family kinase protein
MERDQGTSKAADISTAALVGQERTAEIYVWGDNQILKLFRSGSPLAAVEQETRISQIIHELGLPVPATGGMIEVDGRHGILFERIDGPSMLRQLGAKPWTAISLLHVFADLHVRMHAHTVREFPSQRQHLTHLIQQASASSLPAEWTAAALTALNQLPDGSCLCHGDYHPDNVLMSPTGPIILDWSEATCGNPLADVANTSLIFRLGAPPPGGMSRLLIGPARAVADATYVRGYLKRAPALRAELAAWHLPIAAARLGAGIPEEQQRLLAQIETLVRTRDTLNARATKPPHGEEGKPV